MISTLYTPLFYCVTFVVLTGHSAIPGQAMPYYKILKCGKKVKLDLEKNASEQKE